MSLGSANGSAENPKTERERNAGDCLLPVREENRRQDDFKDPNRYCHRITSVGSV